MAAKRNGSSAPEARPIGEAGKPAEEATIVKLDCPIRDADRRPVAKPKHAENASSAMQVLRRTAAEETGYERSIAHIPFQEQLQFDKLGA